MIGKKQELGIHVRLVTCKVEHKKWVKLKKMLWICSNKKNK